MAVKKVYLYIIYIRQNNVSLSYTPLYLSHFLSIYMYINLSVNLSIFISLSSPNFPYHEGRTMFLCRKNWLQNMVGVGGAKLTLFVSLFINLSWEISYFSIRFILCSSNIYVSNLLFFVVQFYLTSADVIVLPI